MTSIRRSDNRWKGALKVLINYSGFYITAGVLITKHGNDKFILEEIRNFRKTVIYIHRRFSSFQFQLTYLNQRSDVVK